MSSDVDASPLHPVVSRRWRLSPAYISVLLHCYCRCDEIPNRNAPVIVDALREFIEYITALRSRRRGERLCRCCAALRCQTRSTDFKTQEPASGSTNASDQRLVRCIAWLCTASY